MTDDSHVYETEVRNVLPTAEGFMVWFRRGAASGTLTFPSREPWMETGVKVRIIVQPDVFEDES